MSMERPSSRRPTEADPELRDFLEVVSEPVSSSARSRAREISAQLVRSRGVFVLQFVVTYVLGYFVSLSICEQHNIGFFLLSETVAGWLAELPPLGCAAACGTLFTGVPFLASRIAMNRFEQRYLLSRLWWIALPVPVVAVMCLLAMSGVLFAPEHHHGASANGGPLWMAVWLATAVMTPYVLEGLTWALFLRRRVSEESLPARE